MERNALLAVVISLLILVVWNELVIKQYAPPIAPPDVPVRKSPIAAPGDTTAAAPLAAAPVAAPAAVANPGAAPLPQETGAQLRADREIVVETDLLRAIFTSAGGRLKSLELIDYKQHAGADSPLQELVNASAAALPLGVLLRGGQDTLDDASIDYVAERAKMRLIGPQSGILTLVGKSGATEITKRIELTGDSYLWSATVEVVHPPDFATEMAVTWGGVLREGDAYSVAGPGASPYTSVLTLQGDTLETRALDDTAVDTVRVAGATPRTGAAFDGPINWIGLSGQYFFSGLIANGDAGKQETAAWAGTVGSQTQAMLRFPGATTHADIAVYTGPKDISLLEQAGHSLRRALDLGWFTFVALPLLRCIRFLNRFTGNYGIDIILLTVLIKILFYPLTQKSFKSMKAMQKLQPQMERLKEVHKDSPDKMNQAVLELYRKEGVNPLGGCLPMLLQLPVFVGLYNALSSAVELRHAPFVAWIQDLSAPDRLGDMQLPFVTGAGIPILTLVMGASMLIQQKMTPATTADPMQQRMMMLMPIVFTFMFINFPAGLTLYWLVNNILTIGQQYLINSKED